MGNPTSVYVSDADKAWLDGHDIKPSVVWHRGMAELKADLAAGREVPRSARDADLHEAVRRLVAAELARCREESPSHVVPVSEGTAVFREPGGDPVAGAEVPAPRKRGRSS